MMKLLLAFTFVLFSLSALAVDEKLAARYSKFRTQSTSSTPLKLDDGTFEELTQSPRDYAALILLTAIPSQYGCHLCRDFQPEFEILSRSWLSGDKKGDSRMVFATLDFPDGKSVFQKVWNCVNTFSVVGTSLNVFSYTADDATNGACLVLISANGGTKC